MIRKFILEGREPVEVSDLKTWGAWFFRAKRRVAMTTLGDFTVSTVFLGIDHQYGDGPPLLFETIVFGPDGDECSLRRYSTWAEAEYGHAKEVEAYD